jgi:hypothetical protein
VLAVILLVVAFWRRAYSLHAPWERVWRLIAGGAEVQEPRLRAFMQEMRDLEKFRLVYGLNITNMADMHRFIAWVRRHRLDVALLQKARRWVDISKPEIVSRPSKRYYGWNLLVCLLSVLCLGVAALFASSPALLRMKSSGVWFSSDGTFVAGPLGSHKVELTPCPTMGDKLQKTFGISAAETKVLCEARENGSLLEFTKKTTFEQRISAALMALWGSAWLLIAFLRIRGAEAADHIADRVGQPKLQASKVLESQPVAAAHSAVPPPTEQTS